MTKKSAGISTNTKIGIGFTVIIGLLILTFITVALVQRSGSTAQVERDPVLGSPSVVRDDSHRLDDVPGSAVTVVEFLDFECEACGAFYPAVESLREKYEGQITYVLRYFPLPGHSNSQNAAVAVEAAARQGQMEAMYHRMFETQAEWGESQESKAAVFRGFAETMGLDMGQYDADVADPTTLERVMSDFAEGQALGISSTPTFFVNGRVVPLSTLDDVEIAVAAELAK